MASCVADWIRHLTPGRIAPHTRKNESNSRCCTRVVVVVVWRPKRGQRNSNHAHPHPNPERQLLIHRHCIQKQRCPPAVGGKIGSSMCASNVENIQGSGGGVGFFFFCLHSIPTTTTNLLLLPAATWSQPNQSRSTLVHLFSGNPTCDSDGEAESSHSENPICLHALLPRKLGDHASQPSTSPSKATAPHPHIYPFSWICELRYRSSEISLVKN